MLAPPTRGASHVARISGTAHCYHPERQVHSAGFRAHLTLTLFPKLPNCPRAGDCFGARRESEDLKAHFSLPFSHSANYAGRPPASPELPNSLLTAFSISSRLMFKAGLLSSLYFLRNCFKLSRSLRSSCE